MSDKKWFIYVTNHHEGPFTVEEIVSQTLAGVYSKQSYVWAQGMPDWVPMSTVPEFSSAMSARTQTGIQAPPSMPSPPRVIEPIEILAPIVTQPGVPDIQDQTVDAPVEKTRTSIIEKKEITGQIIKAEVKPLSPEEQVEVQQNVEGFLRQQEVASRKRKLAGLAFFALLGFGAGIFVYSGYFDLVADRLRSRLITIPQLSDVDPVEYADLVAAVKASPKQGPKVAVAVSRADSLAPALYVTSNLPAGTSYEIYLEGIPQTLLNTLSAKTHVSVTVDGKFAKSASLRIPENGGVLPRGEYNLYLVEAPVGHSRESMEVISKLPPLAYEAPEDVPPGRKIFFQKRVFLGGRDESYRARLKEYHERLLSKAAGEREELKQTVASLLQQVNYIQSEYDRLKKQRLGPLQVKAWNAASENFVRIQNDVNTRVNAQLNQESKSVIYLGLYQKLQPTLSNIDSYFRLMGSYFKGGVSFIEIDKKLLPLKEAAMKDIRDIDSALMGVESRPTDAVGLPRRL